MATDTPDPVVRISHLSKKYGNITAMHNISLDIYNSEKILMEQLEPLPELQQGEKIGILVITLANPYWITLKESYEKAAEELGVNVEVMAAPTENDTKSQLETLQAMVAKDYDGLIVSPIEPFNLVPGVVERRSGALKLKDVFVGYVWQCAHLAEVELPAANPLTPARSPLWVIMAYQGSPEPSN